MCPERDWGSSGRNAFRGWQFNSLEGMADPRIRHGFTHQIDEVSRLPA